MLHNLSFLHLPDPFCEYRTFLRFYTASNFLLPAFRSSHCRKCSFGVSFRLLLVLLACTDLRLQVCFRLELSYMIIGLTSLCLYNNTVFREMQYGILYKVNKVRLLKTQKTVPLHKMGIDIFSRL